MPMTHAEFVEAALRQKFPALEIKVREGDFGNQLCVGVQHEDRRWAISTPPDVDYKSNDDRYWIHRFAATLRAKFGEPA